MKKRLSFILALLMIFTSSITVFAYPQLTEEYIFNTLYESYSNDSIIDLSEYNGVYYYYEQNGSTVISMRKNIDGTVDIYNNEGGNEIKSYTIDHNTIVSKYNSKLKSSTTNNLLELFSKIKLEIINDNIIPNKVKEINNKLSTNNNLKAGGIDSLCEDTLIEEFGNEYNDKYITSLTERGYTAKLYEYMSFGFYKDGNKYINAIIDISELAASFFTLPKIISAILFVKTVNGIVYALADQSIASYSTTVYFDKYGKVNNILRYRAGKNEDGTVFIGDKSSYYRYGNTSKDYIFDNNTSILQKAIDNHIYNL